MPAYDYRCKACRETFEVVRPVSDASDVSCPACGAEAKRLFTPVGVVFKGSGFHNTDYRRKSDAGEPAPAESGCAGAEAGSDKCASCPASAVE
ncbi:MAG: hypothetical protein IBX62_04065 [Coriobacteriia bacterium]|nr:hypothetical protein [Coriobacteriia bacterium]